MYIFLWYILVDYVNKLLEGEGRGKIYKKYSNNYLEIEEVLFLRITENISFIPRNILNRCQLIPFKRPTKSAYSRVTSKSLMNDINIKNVVNIKDIKSKVRELHNMNKIVCDKILYLIKNYQEIQFLHLRDLLYDIFIYNLNIHTCLYFIVNNLVTESYLNEDTIE